MTKRIAAAATRLATVTLATMALAAAAHAGSQIDQRAPADPTGQVEISNTAGTVEVHAWARDEVEVTGKLGDSAERLEFSRSGKLTRVKVIMPGKTWRGGDTDLVVKVPAGSSIFVNTVSADVLVRGVRGAQRLQSVSGNLDTEAATEDVECKSVSGDVRVTGAGQRGLLTVTTVSGDATLSRVAGEVNGNTVSGDLVITVSEATRSRLRSTSGDLGLKGSLADDARLDFESISGDVRLDLQGAVGAEFEVSSFNGDIHNCFGPKPQRTSEYAPGSELRFREGAGNARVRIKTLNGDINLCNR